MNADNLEIIKTALMMANIIFTLVVAIIASRNRKEAELDRKDKATVSAITRIEKNLTQKIDEVDKRLSVTEQYVSQAPTHSDLGKIYERLNTAIGEVKELTGEFKHITTALNRLYENELARGSK